jgi:lipopolysaccharide/colanic/teichoic acid biosynthesis glycosyltransferase
MKIKRIFDFISAVIGLILFFPVLLIITILIKTKMPGPAFFTQKRVGQHGKLFTMVKFRTMTVNHGGSSISVKGESRITPLGATLRKYKLDELPELWNVLKGEMSFVGPRPDVPGYADELEGEDRQILKLKPGITGPASMKYANEEEILAEQEDPIKYNNEVIYPDKVRINLEYLKHQSFWLDMKIIIYTVLGKELKEDWM